MITQICLIIKSLLILLQCIYWQKKNVLIDIQHTYGRLYKF